MLFKILVMVFNQSGKSLAIISSSISSALFPLLLLGFQLLVCYTICIVSQLLDAGFLFSTFFPFLQFV